MNIELVPETGSAEITLENLRRHLAAGLTVKDCEIRGHDVYIIFNDREYHAVGFKVGELCRPFAQFVVEAGLDRRVNLVERYLAALSADEIQGAICWVDFEKMGPGMGLGMGR